MYVEDGGSNKRRIYILTRLLSSLFKYFGHSVMASVESASLSLYRLTHWLGIGLIQYLCSVFSVSSR